MCNAITSLAKGVAGVAATDCPDEEALRMTLRWTRLHLDQAETALDVPEETKG